MSAVGDRERAPREERTNRLDGVFAGARPALICYLPLGDPEASAAEHGVYVECGVDVLEIGVPAAQPLMDGPTIAASLWRAAAAGLTPTSAGDRIASLRADLPGQALVWMSYPHDDGSLLADLVSRSGADALLLPRQARRFGDVAATLEQHGLHLIHFLAHDPRLRDIAAARAARGYVMLQAAAGVTGSRRGALRDTASAIDVLRSAGVTAPIALGVGLSTPEHVRAAVGMGADGVVVGSATVEAAMRGQGALRAFLHSLRDALDE
jgi:tryptophan synthase alpha chain